MTTTLTNSTIATSLILLSLASSTSAQDAVQWRTEDGGNGHWYQQVPVSLGSFEELIEVAEVRGAQPVSVTSQGEHDLVASLVTSTTPETWSYLGARINTAAGCGPNSWFWLDGSSWSYTNWDQSNPTNQPDCAGSDAIVIGRPNGSELLWHDGPITNTAINVFAIVEWSADCNGDGIVDYGQILDGSLADSNGNGVPDCCDEGTCLPPAQWRVEDGGNGHWYQLVETDLTDGLLDQLQDQLAASGANLVSIEDQAEQDHVVGLSAGLSGWTALGAKIMTSVPCDATSWEWFDAPSPDTRIEFTAWDVESEQPDCGESEYIATWGVDVEQPLVNAGLWHDVPGTSIRYAVIEWSADCNGDNIVDYGQILDGTLADSNGNGIPDCCDVGTCLQLSADINGDGCIDGIDLTFILGFWGPVEPGSFESTVDLNQDGVINGNDLARLLSDWSPCP